jgi:hypothetical protein
MAACLQGILLTMAEVMPHLASAAAALLSLSQSLTEVKFFAVIWPKRARTSALGDNLADLNSLAG